MSWLLIASVALLLLAAVWSVVLMRRFHEFSRVLGVTSAGFMLLALHAATGLDAFRPSGAAASFPDVLGFGISLAGLAVLALLQRAFERHLATDTARHESEERLRLAVNASGIGVWNWDLKTRRTTYDRRMREIFDIDPGLDPQDEARQFYERVHPDDRERTLREVQEARAGGRDYDLDYRVIHRDGRVRHIFVKGAVLKDGAGEAVRLTGVTLDATDRRLAELEREALIEELETKNKELERFTYSVSHDLKSPLLTIRGFLGFLRRDAEKGDTERVEMDLSRIESAASNMQELLDTLLELSRIGRVANPAEEIALDDLVGEALRQVGAKLDAGGVEVEVEPDLPVVWGDRVRLLQVFQNLFDNAAKFIGEQPAPKIEVGGRDEGREIVCWVRDNGKGIAPQHLKKIFGLFERLDSSVEGSGVGLAMVQRILEVHGGRLWVESPGLGRGCTFWIALPHRSRKTGE